MKLRLLLLGCILSQFVSANDIKFGKVSKEEVEATQHDLEPDADAAILYKNEWIRFNYDANEGWTTIKEVHYRIKIYNKDGFDWATLQVPLYAASGDEEKISGVKGFTFNLVDGKIVGEKLKKDGVFEEEVNKYRKKASITMPEVKEGSVLDIEFRVSSPLFWYMDDFKLQYGIPVDQVEIQLDIPEYFIFKQYSRGGYPFKLSQTVQSRSINVAYRSVQSAGGTMTKSSHQNQKLDFTENVYNITGSRLPALIEEKYTNNIDNYRTSIKFELASTRFPNSLNKNYSLTWEDVAKSIYSYDSFGPELSKSNYFEDDVDQVIANYSSMEEKAAAIFAFVKSKMTWDGYSGVSCSSDGVRKAYKQGTGNVAEINLMLTSMFRYAGLNANPILVSTRSHGIPLFPTSDGFNYVISGIEIQDDVILFDATEKSTFPNILPLRALNWYGRLIRKDGSSSSVDLMPRQKSLDAVIMNIDFNDGGIEGKYRQQYTHNNAFQFRDMYNSGTHESFLEKLEKEHVDLEISGYELQNNLELDKPVVQSFQFEKEGGYEIIGGKLFFSPMFHLATLENPFKAESREFPVDYGYPWEDKYIINIAVPEGYAIESIPEPMAVVLPENMGQFRYNITTSGDKINVRLEKSINTSIVPSNYYADLKEFYRHIVEKESEKIILVKL